MSCDRRPHTQRGALGALLALGVAGCTTVVVPPARVVEPAQVALLDHGRFWRPPRAGWSATRTATGCPRDDPDLA